jgi:hypothetical protein
MRRRLPHESKQLLAELASWIEWRYAHSAQRLVLTSAPTTLPLVLERTTDAVWRLAWQESGAAILYGLAPGDKPGEYSLLQHDAVNALREGVFAKLSDRNWNFVSGDSLVPEAVRLKRPIRRRVA